jgi:hypothetical protein
VYRPCDLAGSPVLAHAGRYELVPEPDVRQPAPFRRCFSLFAACTDDKNILKLIVVSAVGSFSGENQRGRLTEKKKMGQDDSLERDSLERNSLEH